MQMRKLTMAVITAGFALTSSAVSAAPSFSVVWTGTSGTGSTGSDTIAASDGDVLTLAVLLNVDADGLTGYDFGLNGTNVDAISGTSCPAGSAGGSANNPANGTCTNAAFSVFLNPTQPELDANGSDINFYTFVTISPVGAQAQPFYVGRGVFEVVGSAGGQVEVGLNPLATINLADGLFNGSLDIAIATIVPEPATAALMGLGLAALGAAGRRR